MGFRGEPRTTEEHIAYVYELLRGLRPTPSSTVAAHNFLSPTHLDTDFAADKADGYVPVWNEEQSRWIPEEIETGGGHTHDGTGADSTVVGGVAEAGPTAAQAAFARSVVIGDSATTRLFDSVTIGWNARGDEDSVVIGSDADGQADSFSEANVLIGAFATAEKVHSTVAIGPHVYAATGGSGVRSEANVAIGTNAFVRGDFSVAIGPSAAIWQTFNGAPFMGAIAIGQSAYCEDSKGSIAIGTNSFVDNVANAVAIGRDAIASHFFSATLGAESVTDADEQVMLGTEFTHTKTPGGRRVSLIATSSDHTLEVYEHALTVDATGGNRTVTLRPLSGKLGQVYRIKKIDSSANTVTIDADASETIDGATTRVLTAQYEAVDLVAGASEWHIF